MLALATFAYRLGDEPHFVDESAFISQSFYADLLLDGRRDDANWLTYPAIDLPPLPKYLIGIAFRAAGLPRPGPEAARDWYLDTSRQFVGQSALVVARCPSLILGVVGCLGVYALGGLAGDRRVGVLAALLVMINPLYRLHARRAMADIPAEAFLVLTEALGLWIWCRTLSGGKRGILTALGVPLLGIAGGLAVEAKLNGGLGLMVVVAWTFLGLLLPGIPMGRKARLAAATAIAIVIAFATFVAGNPALTARPGSVPRGLEDEAGRSLVGRTFAVIDHRATVSEDAKRQFPHNALLTMADKLQAVAVQGFGRFGPFGPAHSDSTIRYDRAQDWGAAAWLPLVVAGVVVGLVRGDRERRAGGPAPGWALVVLWALSMVVVTGFIPLAWDRYFLSIQVGNALMGATAIMAIVDGCRGFRPGRAT